MAGWQDLPTELIILIVSFLDQRSFASTSLVSHLLRTVSEKHLYCSLAFGLFKETIYDPENAAKESKAMRCLIRTFVQRPELCSRVQNVKIGYFPSPIRYNLADRADTLRTLNSSAPDDETAQAYLNSRSHKVCAELSWVFKACRDAGMSVGWIYCQAEPFWGLLILVLHQLPCLDALNISDLGCAMLFIQLARGQISGGIPKCIAAISTLAILHSSGSDSHRYDRNHIVAELAFMLPNLSSICISDVCIISPARTPTHGSSTERIRHIELRGDSRIHFMTPDELGHFLRLFTALESFALTQDDDLRPELHSQINSRGLATALTTHAPSLSSLIVTCGICSDGRRAPVTFINPIGSLHGFVALQHVTIRLDVLIARASLVSTTTSHLSDLLPSSLITLYLILPHQWTLAQFTAITGCPLEWNHERLRFPGLRSFTLQYFPARGVPETVSTETLSAFDRANIVLVPQIGV